MKPWDTIYNFDKGCSRPFHAKSWFAFFETVPPAASLDPHRICTHSLNFSTWCRLKIYACLDGQASKGASGNCKFMSFCFLFSQKISKNCFLQAEMLDRFCKAVVNLTKSWSYYTNMSFTPNLDHYIDAKLIIRIACFKKKSILESRLE